MKVFDSDHGDEEDDWVEKDAETNELPGDETANSAKAQRDGWMQEPSTMDIEHVQSRKPREPPSQFVSAKDNQELKVSTADANDNLVDLQRDFDSDEEGNDAPTTETAELEQRQIDYTFGDSGSSWRMTKLKAVYRQAEESGKPVDEVALERFGNMQDFDNAREEEREMDRRRMYGKEYTGLERPSGDLYQERKAKLKEAVDARRRDEPMHEQEPETTVAQPAEPVLDPTALNKTACPDDEGQASESPSRCQTGRRI